MNKTSHHISLADETTNCITAFTPEKTTGQSTVIVLFPAMGVGVSYYESFAEKLCEHGLIVVTADIRGHGLSSERASSKTDFGYFEIVEKDYPAIIDKVKTLYPENPFFIMGHSLGGQMASLFLSKTKTGCKGLILIACCSVYYKNWDGVSRWGTLLFTQVFGFIPKILGYFPGKQVRFAGTEAKTQMADWSYQARTGNYRPKNSSFDYEKALSMLNIPILAVSMKGDNLAPKKAVDHLLGKFHPDSKITHLHLSKEDMNVAKVNHFSWVKMPGNLVKFIVGWV